MAMMMKNKVIGSSSISSTSTPNGKQADDLTEDLILEIFTHLPPISLLRFKSVSKSLHSLISNPDFLLRNTIHQFRRQDPSPPPPPGILLRLEHELYGDSKILIISPTPLHGDGDGDSGCYSSKLLQDLIQYRPEHDQPDGNATVEFTLIDSCNGLLLYLKSIGHQNPSENKYIWYVCNPITKDYIKLPTFEEEEELGFGKRKYASLVFDPSLSLTYKVVIWLHEYGGAWRLYVYSSETRSWRLSVSLNNNDFAFHVLQKQFNRFDFRAVLLNGVLYWSTLAAAAANMDALLCYDVEKDSVWTLKFPKMPVGHVHRKLFYFGVCGGGLRLIEKYYMPYMETSAFPFSFDVMEMNQLQLQQQHQDGNIDRDLWTVRYRFNIRENGSCYANLIKKKFRYHVFILDLYKTTTMKAGGEGEAVLLGILNNDNDMLVISFNLSDNTFGKKLRQKNIFSEFTYVLRYDNITLFPLH